MNVSRDNASTRTLIVFIALFLIMCFATADAQPISESRSSNSNASSWSLVWSDEFDGMSINTSNWTYDLRAGGWGNSESEYYTSRLENASINNGMLNIIARKESYSGSNYTSARMKSQGLRSFTYGRVEASIKLPVGQALWPAFWMLGNNITTVGWPKCGEIDILEHINSVPVVNGTMHWDNNGHVSYGGTTACDVTRFHTYAVEWDSTSIRWFVDSVKYLEGNIAGNINSTEEFHLPFFIILNLAVGGSWPGNPDNSTPFPDTMFVDYVRVYQHAVSGVNAGHEPVPDHSTLLQNYPNPFNPSTLIRYGIPSGVDSRKNEVGRKITLIVYDLLGREVATLVNEVKSPGTYTVSFDGSRLASGVYLCALSSNNRTSIRKMTLLR